MGQVHAWMMATALDYGPCCEHGSSSIFARNDGEPQIVANSLTTSFALNLIGPLSREQTKGSLPVCNIFGEPIFMHPPETPKAFEYIDSFQFIGWFVPVGSEPRLALKTTTCKKEVVWFPKFMTVQRKDVIEVTLFVLVAADGVKTENRSNCRGPSSRVARCPQSMRSERPRWLVRTFCGSQGPRVTGLMLPRSCASSCAPSAPRVTGLMLPRSCASSCAPSAPRVTGLMVASFLRIVHTFCGSDAQQHVTHGSFESGQSRRHHRHV